MRNFFPRSGMPSHRSRSDGPAHESSHANGQRIIEEQLDQVLPASWDIGENIRGSSIQLSHENYDYTYVTIRNSTEISRVTVAANQAIPTSQLQKVASSRQTGVDMPSTTRSTVRPDLANHTSANALYPKILPSNRNLQADIDEYQELLLSKLSSDSLYYFEVEISVLPNRAVAFVGLVLDELGASGIGTVPGEMRNSIGLDSNGVIKIGGKTIDSEIWHLDNQKGVNIEGFREGDVIGCAVEVSGMRRILFTKNGKIIVPATRFNDIDMRANPLCPAFGVYMHRNQTSKFLGNFGLDVERPLLWAHSEYMVCKLAAESSAVSYPTLMHPLDSQHRSSSNGKAPLRQQSDPRWRSSSSAPSDSPQSPRSARNPSGGNRQSMSLSPGAASPSVLTRRRSRNPRTMEGEPPTIETTGERRSQLRQESRGSGVFGTPASTCLVDDESDLNAPGNLRHDRDISTGRERARSHETLGQVGRRQDPRYSSAASLPSGRQRHGSYTQHSLEFDTLQDAETHEPDPFYASAPVYLAGQPDQLHEMSNHGPSVSSAGAFTPKDIDFMKDNIRMLRSVCEDHAAVDASVLENILDCCKADQQAVQVALEKAMTNEDSSVDLMELIGLNELVMDAIKLGEELIQSSVKKAVEQQQQQPRLQKKANTAMDLDINGLIRKKDVFSLICILRAQSDQRLDAALALMEFARDGDTPEEGGISLRDEIRSSGGMHSLLQVFRAKGTSYELRVVAGMAVAYVLPSFVETSPSVGLKIMECLRFLSSSRPVCPNGVRISSEMMFEASVLGVTAFWMNALEPMLNSGMSVDEVVGERPDLHLQNINAGFAAASGIFDQGHQTLELQELLEMTVSLIVHIEKNCESPVNSHGAESNEALAMWRYTNVEQVCTVDVARPIAVREGLLPILVEWIKSKNREKVRPAVSALRYLTSIKDKYMAGWIHSQMVNEGALSEVVKLADDYNAGHDVRLAVAQILSSLCVAPHTRAAVVEAKCMYYLIGFLYDHADPASEEVALYAGRAITQLAAGAIMRASVFGGGDADILDFVSPDKRDSLVE